MARVWRGSQKTVDPLGANREILIREAPYGLLLADQLPPEPTLTEGGER